MRGRTLSAKRARPSAWLSSVCSDSPVPDIRIAAGSVQAALEGLTAFFADERVRIVPLGQEKEADLTTLARFRQSMLQGAPGRRPAGAVAIEGKHHFSHQTEDAPEMLGSGRRAERRDRVSKTRLMQANGVHIPFDHQQRSRLERERRVS